MGERSRKCHSVMEFSLVVKASAIFLMAQLAFSVADPTSGKRNLNKRSALTFPPDSALQINAGFTLASPLDSNSAAIVLAFQQNAPLPQQPSPPSPPPLARRFSIYRHLETTLASYGFDGAECLRKMVCQMGEAPLLGGLVEDVLSFLLSPSRHRSVGSGAETERERRDMERLLESEMVGAGGGNCSRAFPKCGRTPLDMVSTLIRV